jgi:hypothetical protein
VEAPYPIQVKMNRLKTSVLNKILSVYQKIAMYCAIIAFAAILLGLFRQLRKNGSLSEINLFNIAVFSAIFLRIVVTLIETTSFPAISTQYLAPVYPLLIIFLFLAVSENAPYFFRTAKITRGKSSVFDRKQKNIQCV